MMDGKVSRVSTTSTGSRGQLESIKKVAVTMTGQQALFMELNQVCYLLSKPKTFNAEKCPQCLNQKFGLLFPPAPSHLTLNKTNEPRHVISNNVAFRQG